MRRRRRSGISETLGTFILLATSIGGAAIAISTFSTLAAAQTSTGASIQLQSIAITQGSYVASIKIIMSNSGSVPITSLAISTQDAQASSATFSGTAGVTDLSTWGALPSTTSMSLSASNLTFTVNIGGSGIQPGRAIALTVTVTRTSAGLNLFNPGGSYVIDIATVPYTNAIFMKIAAASA